MYRLIIATSYEGNSLVRKEVLKYTSKGFLVVILAVFISSAFCAVYLIVL